MSKWIKKNYPDVKSDLCTCFIERIMGLCEESGLAGITTSNSWMFLSSFEKLRENMVNIFTIETLVQLSVHGFHGIAAQVCTFVLRNSYSEGYLGGYIRLNDFDHHSLQQPKTLEAIANPDCGYFYRRNAKTFTRIPGTPIAYWVSDALRNLIAEGVATGYEYEVGSGLSTGDNDRFLRRIWEVPSSRISYDGEIPAKWYFFQKGGDYRKWYGNLEYVVNWEEDGRDIKYWVTHNPKDPNTTSWSRRIFNTHLYFKEGFSWSVISSGVISFRWIDRRGMISNAAGGVFSTNDNSFRRIPCVLGAFNTNIWREIFSLLNPTLNYSSGIIAKAPLPSGHPSVEVDGLVSENVSISKADWDSFETSWDFKRHPLV